MNKPNTKDETKTETNVVLQPLREVGCDEKTQYWDIDEIRAAIREAYRLGISPDQLASAKRQNPAA